MSLSMTPPVRLLAAAADQLLADHLRATVPAVNWAAAETPTDVTAAVRDTYHQRQPCVFVGSPDWFILTIAPLLVTPAAATAPAVPIVVVTPTGAVLPLLGAEQGGTVLAQHLSAALATPARVQPPQPRRLAVVGLGPGAVEWRTPAVSDELARAEDIVGYTTYVRMAGPFRADQRVLDSDNRCELERARLAFELAAAGRHVAVVSSGDPGVFAMAAAVLEALEQSTEPAWAAVDIAIVPGISAAHAVAARVGAPLGHDFCVLSLSDNLKPWSVITQRLEYAARADLVIALYNPSSRARPWQFAHALEVLRRHRAATTPVVLGHDVSRPGERVVVTTLAEVNAAQVDMRTLVIVGSTHTRHLPRSATSEWVYTPRWYPASGAAD